MSYKYWFIGVILVFATGLHARTFSKGEEIYVNAKQGDAVGNWAKDNAKLYLYLFEGSKNEWLPLQQAEGDIYKAVFSNGCSYSQLIVVRGSAPDWSSKWNQTSDIDIPADWNCIDNFSDASHRWKMYTPAISIIGSYKSGVSEEKISVCPSALGTQFSLKAKLNSAKTAYVYDDITAHGWFASTNGTSWISVDDFAGKVRDGEQNKDTFAILPATLSTSGIYYFLFSSNPKGRRLIHITADAAQCDLDCEITSFETAISAVNADNNTFTLDGMVAFGEAEGKKLIIECEGNSITIDDPKSPQSFSLQGVKAATTDGVTYQAKAYFENGGEACSKTITIQVPNSTEAEKVTTIFSHIGAPVTLSPTDTDPNNEYIWLVNGDTIKDAPQQLVLDTFRKDTTITFVYKEFYPPVGSMEDLMENGSYEESQSAVYGVFGQVSNISDYNFWGMHMDETAINFYENTPTGVNPSRLKDNGFAVVRNANHFAPSYAKVEARDGNNFALFDAVTGAKGGNKRAWYATTAKNPKLKLQAGTTYVLSFWAANINNYGEMDNAAKFIFRIEYNGKKWESKVLDLSKSEFRNNIWHQHSETFFANEDCDNITISVVNLNTNELNVGNDFALDDIQFHPISSVSRVVKSQQKFIVTIHKPVTFRDTICEGESYDQNGFTLITPAVGDYELVNTIKDTLRLTVGDDHAMYSKWEDVLFIDNHDLQYIAYQWFKNGALLEGETQQRYYNPNGLKGTNDTYYCRMKTMDNHIFITCTYRFDEVPRSAESKPSTPPQIIHRWCISPHVYVVQIQLGDQIETRKIITPYE